MAYYLVRQNERSTFFEESYATREDAFRAGCSKFKPGWLSNPTFEITEVIDIPTIPDLDVVVVEAYVKRMKMDGFPSEVVEQWRNNISTDDLDNLYVSLKKEFENWLSYTDNLVEYEMRRTEVVESAL